MLHWPNRCPQTVGFHSPWHKLPVQLLWGLAVLACTAPSPQAHCKHGQTQPTAPELCLTAQGGDGPSPRLQFFMLSIWSPSSAPVLPASNFDTKPASLGKVGLGRNSSWLANPALGSPSPELQARAAPRPTLLPGFRASTGSRHLGTVTLNHISSDLWPERENLVSVSSR